MVENSSCPRVDLVILNWNGKKYLEDCLPSVLAQTYPNFGIILVDNGSTDGSIEFVREQFPQVHLICNTENKGFAGGNNQGMRLSRADYVATLNNDTRLEPNWLAELVEVMERRPELGMAASKMLFAHQPDLINSAGICLDRAGIAWDWRGGELDNPDEQQPQEIFGACAGAALYRKQMLDQIGLFDEDFIIYMEDVDLAWRAQLAGWRCLFVPAARVYHATSATVGQGSATKNRLLSRNKIWMIIKNYPLRPFLLNLGFILIYDLAFLGYATLVRRDLSIWRGKVESLPKIPRMFMKRRAVQALAGRPAASRWQKNLCPLVSPWQMRQRYRHLQAPK